jgi:hypothetical protein
MMRLFPLLILALFTGCASQLTDPERQTQLGIERATHNYQEARLREIYSKAFTRGFLEGWEGHGGWIDTRNLTGDSPDPDGDDAFQMGYIDGQRTAAKAKVAYEEKRLEEKH